MDSGLKHNRNDYNQHKSNGYDQHKSNNYDPLKSNDYEQLNGSDYLRPMAPSLVELSHQYNLKRCLFDGVRFASQTG